MLIGFSTGSLALDNVRLGLQMVEGHATAAIELSALREVELAPLLDSLDSLDLEKFSYISFHAPSKLVALTEHDVVTALLAVAKREWPIIVHPDVITDFQAWRRLEQWLCIENMDKRKPTGRTAAELAPYFEALPDATLCFDIGHARQIDPTMCEADSILRQYQAQLRQVHLSLVNSISGHEPLNHESMLAFRRVSHLLPANLPIILETPVAGPAIDREIEKVKQLLQIP
jgi:hypothetical protein